MRDRDIRRDMQALLDATGQFDGVFLSGIPSSQAAMDRIVIIEPDRAKIADEWDAALGGGVIVDGSVKITFLARHEDPETRDDVAELMVTNAANALQGVSLAGVTLVQHNAMKAWRFIDPEPPERRVIATFQYQYILEGWGAFDTSE